MANPDVFGQLSVVRWRGHEFPITRHRMSIAHDLVEHKYWGVDGARVESTGLAPLRFSFSAPLLNGISPAKNERWAVLYPDKFRSLVAAFQRKDVGLLDHLEFGPILCKAEKMDIEWDATRRGGVDVELSFVETKLADEETSFLENKSPVEEVDVASIGLEAKKADLKKLLEAKGLPVPPYLAEKKTDLTDLMNSVRKITSYPDLLSYRLSGKIASLAYQADRLAASADAARSALTWPVTRDAENLKAAAFELAEKILAGERQIAFFTVPDDTTLAGVVRQCPEARIADVVRLNPSVMRSPVIEKGAVLRYYAPRAA